MFSETNELWLAIPEHMRPGLRLYVEEGIRPGGFLTAVLANDLSTSVAKADMVNRYRLADYVMWLYNEAPGLCWGSYKQVDSWETSGGLKGHC